MFIFSPISTRAASLGIGWKGEVIIWSVQELSDRKASVVPYLGHILGEARSAGFPNLTDASDLITGRNAQDLDFHIKFVSETSHSFIGVRYDRGEQVTSTTNHTTLFCDESTCSSGQRKGAPAFQTAVA